jgi:hypothetical protein
MDEERTAADDRLDLGELGREPGHPGLTAVAAKHLEPILEPPDAWARKEFHGRISDSAWRVLA